MPCEETLTDKEYRMLSKKTGVGVDKLKKSKLDVSAVKKTLKKDTRATAVAIGAFGTGTTTTFGSLAYLGVFHDPNAVYTTMCGIAIAATAEPSVSWACKCRSRLKQTIQTMTSPKPLKYLR